MCSFSFTKPLVISTFMCVGVNTKKQLGSLFTLN